MFKKGLKYLTIFAIVFSVYSSNIIIDYKKDLNTETFRNLLTTHDTVTNNLFPYLLIKHGTFNFHVLERSLYAIRPSASHKYFYITERNENTLYSSFPLVSGFLSVPFYYAPVVTGWVASLETAKTIDIIKVMFLGRLSASLLTALACTLFYKILSLLYKDRNLLVYLMTAFFSFGTLMWSISSRGLWQHTASILFIVIVLLLYYSKEFKYKDILIGFFTGMSVLSRYSSIFFAVPVFMYYLLFKRNNLLNLIIGAVPVSMLLFFTNYIFYGSMLATGYGERDNVKFTTPVLDGLTGLLFSPGRGLMFIVPPLIIATFYGLYCLFRKNYWNKFKFENIIFIGYLLNLLFFSKWYAWHGANSFGPRMLIEFTPILCILLIRLVAKISKRYIILFSVLVFYSIFVEFNAVYYLMSRCHPRDNWNFNCIKPPKSVKYYIDSKNTYFDNLTMPVVN